MTFSITDNYKLYYIILPVLVFIIVPGFVLQENYAGFSYLNGKFVLIILFSVTIVSILLFYLVDGLLNFLNVSSYFRNSVRFLTYLLICTGLITPLSVRSGMMDPANIPIDWINFIISLVSAIALYVISCSKIKQYFTIALYCFLGINLAISLIAFNKLLRESTSLNQSIFSVSSNKNIFVVSFDGLPRDPTIELLQSDPDILKLLRDFLIFKNVIGSSPGTQASIFSELQGNRDFKQEYSTYEDIKKVEPSRLLTNFLDENGFHVSTYGAYNIGFDNEERAHELRSLVNFDRGKVSEALEFFDYALVRLVSSHLLLPQDMVNMLKRNITELLSSTGQNSIRVQWDKHKGPKWDKIFIQTKLDYDAYVEKLEVSSIIPSAHFLHFNYTHFPVDFHSNCELISHDRHWRSSHQDRNSVKEELLCVFMQFEAFINKLKKLDIYDRSLIVFKSDHGKPVKYNDPEKMESFQIRGHHLWGYSRYTPFLAIKPINHNADYIRYDDNPAMLGDLAKTICEHAEADLDCRQFEGYDLLQKDLSIPENATSVIFIVKNSDSDHKFDTHEALHLPRRKDFYSNLHDALTGQIIVNAAKCNEKISFQGAEPWNNGFSDKSSWVMWNDGNSTFLKFRNNSCDVGKILLDIQPAYQKKHDAIDFNIYVDGNRLNYKIGKINADTGELNISIQTKLEANRTTPVLIEVRANSLDSYKRYMMNAMQLD